MDFNPTPQVESLLERIKEFNEEHVFPVEMELLRALDEEVTVQTPRAYPEGLVELRERAKADGLWNLFMPDERYGAGLTNWEYGMLCEEMGRSVDGAHGLQLLGARHGQHGDHRGARQRTSRWINGCGRCSRARFAAASR